MQELRTEVWCQAPDGKQPSPRFLCNSQLQLLFFGSKGGTGKTTTAAAVGMLLARTDPERRVLIMSTDPAHSLGDSLDQPVGREITPVQGFPNLSAVEMDPPFLLEEFRKSHRKYLQQIAGGTIFSKQANIRDFLSLRLPGMEDMMVFQAVAEYLQPGIPLPRRPDTRPRCDLIVVDTAPSGHTLRLLAMPEKFGRWLALFNKSFDRYQLSSKTKQAAGLFQIPGHRRGGSPGVPKFLSRLTKDMKFVEELLADGERCEFVMVTIPEEMAVEETGRLAEELDRRAVAARTVVVNRVHSSRDCPFCGSHAKSQASYLRQIEERFGSRRILKMPFFPREIRGQDALLRYGRILAGGDGSVQEAAAKQAAPEQEQGTEDSIFGHIEPAELAQKRFLIFGGKGGVGKTSVSASSALRLARHCPDKRVLVLSADPAHSLGDSFDLKIGDSPRPIPAVENLTALELDAAALYGKFREQYEDNINAAFQVWEEREGSMMSKKRLQFDRSLLLDYVQSYPPGVEEVLVLERLLEFVEADQFDLYLLDSAPTGHMLKLLAFPELINEWLRVTYRAILRYQRKYPVENLTALANRIIRSRNAVKKMHAAMTDPEQTELLAVTIPEAMGKLELERTVKTVTASEIPLTHIVCNFLTPQVDCAFCQSRREHELSYLEQILELGDSIGARVTWVPRFPHEVRGLGDLEQMSAKIYENGSRDE